MAEETIAKLNSSDEMVNTFSSSLYSSRQPIFPKRVYGQFRNWKWCIMVFTLSIYYFTPWIRFDRGPNLPNQAVLVDLAGRRFYMFWIEIWPHEFFFVAGLLIMAGIGLFFFTSLFGRAWCGYSCPQTVWVDLFILVERWVEGDRNARIKLWRKALDWNKAILRLTKWLIWLIISVLTGGAWVFYYTDAPKLASDLVSLSVPPIALFSIATLTFTTFIFGGFMREQVCIYMCPWPRIQSSMMDENSLTIGYRYWRGEPRGKLKKNFRSLGDCIDCSACVNVCPMGIDIRDGNQMECISCALCIDACNNIMDRIGKPYNLIGYFGLNDEKRERSGKTPYSVWYHILTFRIVLYMLIWGFIGFALLFALFIRPDLEMSVYPIRNPLLVTMSDGSVRNIYELKLFNKLPTTQTFQLNVSNPISTIEIDTSGKFSNIISVPADSIQTKKVFLTAPKNSLAAKIDKTEITFWVNNIKSKKRIYAKSYFNGINQ